MLKVTLPTLQVICVCLLGFGYYLAARDHQVTSSNFTRKAAKENHIFSPNSKTQVKVDKWDEKQSRTRQSLLAFQRNTPSIYDASNSASQTPPDPFEPEGQQDQQNTSWADEVDQLFFFFLSTTKFGYPNHHDDQCHCRH